VPLTGKADTFRRCDIEVFVKSTNSSRRRDLSEDSSSGDSIDDGGDCRRHDSESNSDITDDRNKYRQRSRDKAKCIKSVSLLDMEVLKFLVQFENCASYNR